MGSAVLTDGDAAVGSADLHVQVGVGHGVADLLKGTARSEHRKAGHEGDIAHGGQAGGDAHHVGLGDAAVEVAVRVSLAEHTGLGSGSEVGVQYHQIVVALSGQCFQSIAVALAGSIIFTSAILLLLLFQRGVGCVQLLHGRSVLLVVGAFAVPIHRVGHKGDAGTLDGVQNDAGGLVVLGVERLMADSIWS